MLPCFAITRHMPRRLGVDRMQVFNNCCKTPDPGPGCRRKRRKERLAEMETEVAELARQDKASRRERAALGQRQAELQVRSG